MRSRLLVCFTFIITTVVPLSSELVFSQERTEDSPNWVQVAEKTAFAPRDSCGEVVFDGRMWLIGGWLNSNEDGPRDVWSSADGKEWRLEIEQAPWKHADLSTTLVHNEKMWLMGGWHGGRLPHATASNQVWSSTDGKEWKEETAAAGWSPRLGAAGVSFKGRMWILGGIERYYFGNENDLKNDVWSSKDGATWEQVTAKAPWSPRAYHCAVVHDDKIWIFGGGNYLPDYKAFNDVWSSNDGVHWEQVSANAPWSPRMWFSADVYRGKMWIIGGWSNNPSKNWGDAWHSTDGKNWTELKTETCWTARHEQSAYVFQDSLWVVTGNAWPLVNDVWRLELPGE